MLGTENSSDPITKHSDDELISEHVRSMGCEIVASRTEFKPEFIQDIRGGMDNGDVVDFARDSVSGLMTTSMHEQSATQENHCATKSDVFLQREKL